MAIYFLRTTSVGRSAGRRATAAAAYRAGERLRDERSGLLYNYAHRKDVVHSAIFLPAHLAGAADDWAQSRETLWNAAERAEKQANSRVAREYQVALPHELNTQQQVALARGFARELTERYRVAVDLAVHLPRPDGDPRNFHAHLLTTTREVMPRGLGARAGLDMSGAERRRRELAPHREELRALRERWGILTNEALREAHVEARVDHRSYAERGIDREPLPLIPIASIKMERRGLRSEVAERIREQYRQRVAARLERAQALRAPPAVPADAEEVRRQAREAWLRLRAGHAAGEPQGSRREREPLAQAAEHDDDLAL